MVYGQNIPIGSWRLHVSYSDIHSISVTPTKIYAAASNGILIFDQANDDFSSNVSTITRLDGSSSKNITQILFERRGYLWIGTAEAGLNRMDPVTNEVKRYQHKPTDPSSLSGDSILSIYLDSKDRLWIGTAGTGLNLYHPETDSFTHYVEKDGLPNGSVYGILEDGDGRLWMSTNYGIARFDPDTETFRNYDRGDGLQSNEFNSNAFAKGKNGEFYFGGIDGLTVFHPLEITDSAYPPQISLLSLDQEGQSLAGNSSVETLREITIAYPQTSFEFEFAALSFNQPGKNQYNVRRSKMHPHKFAGINFTEYLRCKNCGRHFAIVSYTSILATGGAIVAALILVTASFIYVFSIA